jgi:branched-chain amino acid transport system ATP-binding protein
MLQVRGLKTSYGASRILHGVDLDVGTGEVVSLMGRNGMGKTTTVSSIMGLVRAESGTVRFNGVEMQQRRAYEVARSGIGLVPEGRQIFPNLSARENLLATANHRAGGDNGWSLTRVKEMFPELGERLDNMGNLLSGGEQQMLAIGRALMTNPKLLILDEATEGLAPLIRGKIWHCLAQLKNAGQSILVIDKNVSDLKKIADRHYILEKGQIAWSGTTDALESDATLTQRFLGV